MAWKPLQLSTAAGAHLPTLLISASFTSDSYAIQLTDLTSIWAESLDRTAIVRRSREEGTSIDPSGADQLKIFLEKIKLGLGGGAGTTLALTVNVDSDRPSLVLSVSVKLPGGLAALEWPVRLAAAPQELLTRQLAIPLLQTQHAYMQELAGLTELLKDKDHVIMKLLDKLEEKGFELGQIFPHAAGKVGRKLSRETAEKKVHGMARFDMNEFRRNLGHQHLKETAQLISEVFSEQTEVVADETATSPEEDQESWWDSIKGITVNLNSGKISTKGPSKTNKVRPQPALTKAETKEDEDDTFQGQTTPPNLAKTSKPTLSKSSEIDDSTDLDPEDLDGPSQRSRSRSSTPPTPKTKPAKKLGSVGAKKQAQAAPLPSPSPPPHGDDDDDESIANESPFHKSPLKQKTAPSSLVSKPVAHRPPKRPLGKIGGNKAVTPPLLDPESEPELDPTSEAEDETGVFPPQCKQVTPPPPQSTAPKPKKGKLGQIGRKKRASSTPPPPSSTSPEISTRKTTEKSVGTPKRRLGVIGGGEKSAGNDIQCQDENVKDEEHNQSQIERGRGRDSIENEKEKTPEPRETSMERADRKRQELKRELEKAKAQVKKKRKF